LGADTPLEFLDISEEEVVFDDKGKLRVSLYKILLFEKVASAIKSGALNLRYSYKYRSFDDYLIPQDVWKTQKKNFWNEQG